MSPYYQDSQQEIGTGESNDFISSVMAEAIRVASEYDGLISERQEILRKTVKVFRQIDALDKLIKYHLEFGGDEIR